MNLFIKALNVTSQVYYPAGSCFESSTEITEPKTKSHKEINLYGFKFFH